MAAHVQVGFGLDVCGVVWQAGFVTSLFGASRFVGFRQGRLVSAVHVVARYCGVSFGTAGQAGLDGADCLVSAC